MNLPARKKVVMGQGSWVVGFLPRMIHQENNIETSVSQGLPIHHLKKLKKIEETLHHQGTHATCQSLGLIFPCNFRFLWWTPFLNQETVEVVVEVVVVEVVVTVVVVEVDWHIGHNNWDDQLAKELM